MNISVLNPKGYEAQTPKGNTYRKKNNWTTGLVASAIVTESLPYLIKNPKGKMIAREFSAGQLTTQVAETVANIKFTPKMRKFTLALGALIGIGTEFIAGRILDKIANNKRAAKVDKAAEAAGNT